jgi:tetratricopeptide (TPR) repeat protein
MSKRLLLLLPVFVAALAQARDKAENWIEVRSPHFRIVTDSNEKQGRQIAGQFERMRSLVHVAFPQLQVDYGRPLVVLAVRDKHEFQTLEPESLLAKGALELNGLFVRTTEMNSVLMRLDAEGSNPYAVVYHEYTHLMLSKAPNIPLWLDEGMAQFYENTVLYQKSAALGGANSRNVMLLLRSPQLPLPTLFAVDEASPYYRDKEKGSMFYAESWALVHYLLFRDYQYKTSKLNEYVNLLAQNVDAVAAAIQVFGDLKKLQAALEHYIMQGSFNYFRTTAFAKVDDSSFEVEGLTAVEADAIKADVLAYNGRTVEARTLVDHVLQEDPTNVSAQETMTFLQSLEVRQAEDSLRNALRSNPSSADACDRLAVFLWTRRRDLEEARTLAIKAVSLEPGNIPYRIDLAKILLAIGRGPDAVETLQAAAKVAHAAEDVQAVNDLLRDAQEYTQAQEEQHRLATEANSRQQETASAGSIIGSGVPHSGGGDTFASKGPHHYVVGMLKDVHCDSARMDLTVDTGGKNLALHAENYYKVEYSALNIPPLKELNPCEDLEGRAAKVEYVEATDQSDVARVLGVELHK